MLRQLTVPVPDKDLWIRDHFFADQRHGHALLFRRIPVCARDLALGRVCGPRREILARCGVLVRVIADGARVNTALASDARVCHAVLVVIFPRRHAEECDPINRGSQKPYGEYFE
jgi:hypothetical protein